MGGKSSTLIAIRIKSCRKTFLRLTAVCCSFLFNDLIFNLIYSVCLFVLNFVLFVESPTFCLREASLNEREEFESQWDFTWLGKSLMSIFVNPARKISPSYDKHGDRRGIIQSWFASVQIFSRITVTTSYISECRPVIKPPVTPWSLTTFTLPELKMKTQRFASLICAGLHVFCACYLHVHDCFVHYFVAYLQTVPLRCNVTVRTSSSSSSSSCFCFTRLLISQN